jgi:hypothetical protein
MLKVIGAGLPRMATTTQMLAFEKLGFAPCYHMRDVLGNLPQELPKWEAAADGRADWEGIFGNAQSTCDFPSARFYKELADYYPGSKVVLTVRDPERWVQSMRKTVWGCYGPHDILYHMVQAQRYADPLWDRYIKTMIKILWEDGTGALAPWEETFSDEGLAKAMERWNEQVKASIPADRLLVWDLNEGWKPLCEFLEVPIPDEPLPHVNDTAAFREGIIGGALATLNRWWEERERPKESLHAAPIAE